MYGQPIEQLRLFSVFQYMLSRIELLKVIDFTNITPGLVYLHTILTSCPYGHTRDEQYILMMRYPGLYRDFIKSKYLENIQSIKDELWAIYDTLDSQDLDGYQQLPMTMDLRDQIDVFFRTDMRDAIAVDDAVQILRPILTYHINQYNPECTDNYYIKDFHSRVMSKIQACGIKKASLDLLQLYILLGYTRCHILTAQQRNEVRDKRYLNLRLFQDKTLSNEVIMCGGIKELHRLTRFSDDGLIGVSDIAQRYIVEAGIMRRKLLCRSSDTY